MTDSKPQAANISAEERRKLLCIPPRGIFDINCKQLKLVRRVYNKKDNLCYDSTFIPADRFQDFKAGEQARGQCLFYSKKKLLKKEKAADAEQAEVDVEKGVRLNDYIEKGTSHCSCGPEDNRNLLHTARDASSDGDSDKPGTSSRMDRTALGCSVRVGCPVRFAFRRQPGTEDIVEIQYYDRQHVNHGTEAQDGPGLGYTSHRISEALRMRVQLKIHRGLSNADIVQQNKDEFLDQYMVQHPDITDRITAARMYGQSKPPKDYFLTSMDVANVRRGLDKREWMFSDNPQESVHMWAQQNNADVLYLDLQKPKEGSQDHAFLAAGQQRSGAPTAGTAKGSGAATEAEEHDSTPAGAALDPAFDGADDDLSRPESLILERDTQPHLADPRISSEAGRVYHFDPAQWTHFAIGVMQDCNVEAAIRWGHMRPLQLDSTFNCNTQKFPVYTLVVVDDHNKAVPIAFCICSQERADLLERFIKAVTDKVRKTKADWLPSAVLVDACDAEIAAVKQAFTLAVAVFLCHWHVQKAWKKQLYAKVKDKANIEPMFADLLQIMRYTKAKVSRAEARRLAKEKLEAFCQRWAAEESFVAYFRKEWGEKLEMIMQIFRDLIGCAINCTSHIEGWHKTLKFCFLSGRRRLCNRRIDWLLWILHTKVAEYYHCRMQDQDLGALKNLQAYKAVRNAIKTADSQPDSSVRIVGGTAHVQSASAASASHTVKLSVGSDEQPIYSCTAGKMGKMCWHIVKVFLRLGATRNQLLRHLGIMQGAVGGGFGGLQSAMSVADGSEATSAAEQPEGADAEMQPSDGCDADVQPSGELSLASSDMMDAQDDPAPDACRAETSDRRAGGKLAAERALAELTGMAVSWEDDSQMWRYMAVALRQAKGQVEKALAGVGSLDDYAGEEFQPNADAPEGDRLKSWLEKAALRHRQKEQKATGRRRAAASGGSDCDGGSEGSNSDNGDPVHPFLPARAAPKKHKSVQQEIRAKHRLHRSSAVESVELLPRSNSAPATASLDMDAGQSMLAQSPSGAAVEALEGPSGSLLPVPVSHSHAAPGTQLLAPRRPRRENIGRPSRFQG